MAGPRVRSVTHCDLALFSPKKCLKLSCLCKKCPLQANIVESKDHGTNPKFYKWSQDPCCGWTKHKARKRRHESTRFSGKCNTSCTKIICNNRTEDSCSSTRERENVSQELALQINARLPRSERLIGMMGTWTSVMLDIWIAHVGAIVTNGLCGELDAEFSF